MGLGAARRPLRLRSELARRHDLQGRRRGVRHLDEGARAAPARARVPARGHHQGRRDQLLVAGSHRAVRPVQRGVHRSRTAGRRRRARLLAGGELRPLDRDLEFRLPAIRPQGGRHPRPAPQAEHRHRRGPRAARAGAAEDDPRHVQDRSLPAAREEGRDALREALRRRPGRRPFDPHRRRAWAGGGVPRRGRDPAEQRVARVRPAPPHPARRAPCAPPRPQGGRARGDRVRGREAHAAALSGAHAGARPHP